MLIFHSCCTRCRSPALTSGNFQSLSCGHPYCSDCLQKLLLSEIENARVVPLTCCKTPLPSDLMKSFLSREDQSRFVRMMLRVDRDHGRQASCSSCGSSMEGKDNLRSDRILVGKCGTCILSSCSTCIREVHAVGQACPAVSSEILGQRFSIKLIAGCRTGHWMSYDKLVTVDAG